MTTAPHGGDTSWRASFMKLRDDLLLSLAPVPCYFVRPVINSVRAQLSLRGRSCLSNFSFWMTGNGAVAAAAAAAATPTPTPTACQQDASQTRFVHRRNRALRQNIKFGSFDRTEMRTSSRPVSQSVSQPTWPS